MNKNRIQRGAKYRRLVLISVFFVLALSSVLTNADLDTDAVNIENVSVYVTDSSVIIYWDTNLLADSLVKYGLSEENLTESNYMGVHSYAHAAEILGLLPETTYYFAVNSTNANGNSNESSIFYFTTLEDNVSPVIGSVNVTPASGEKYLKNNNHRFDVTVTDNGILSNVTIEHNFRNETSTNEMYRMNGTDTYSFEIGNLSAGYYIWQMTAVDISGNIVVSPEYNYTINKSSPNISLMLNGVENGLEIEQKTSVNITGLLMDADFVQGAVQIIVENTTSIINQSSLVANYSNSSNSLSGITILQFFDAPGIYKVTFSYNETMNYSASNVSYLVNVTPIEVNLFISEPEYELGESVNYVVLAPNTSNLSIEVCGPFPTGAGFVECKTIIANQRNDYPYTNIQKFTNKTGTYRIRAQIQYKGLVRFSEKNYTVINNIQINIAGDTTVLVGKTSEILATATGGIGTLKYNWTLSNGTKITGQNLNVRYNTQGSYPVVLTVNDDAGNYKTSTLTLLFKRFYVVKVLVTDEANLAIESARVRIDGESENTDDEGYAIFEVIEGTYDLRVTSTGYSSYSGTVKSDANKTVTIKLPELDISSNEPLEISLLSPENNKAMNTKQVNFRVYVDLGGNTDATCMFYVAEDNNDWYRVMKTISVKTSSEIAHLEEFAGGKSFTWKVQCDSGSKTYSSSVWKFASTGQEESDAELTILGLDNEIIDAGEIRRRIDLALTNLDAMDMESMKDADALQFTENVNKALRDYERAMRDISNIKYRKDLSEAEQEAKKLEYYNSLRSLEDIVPLNIKNLGYQTFISYPTTDDLWNLSKEYQLKKNIIGRASESALAEYQNGIIVTTRISNVEVTYLGGKKEVLTLVIKTIKVLDNSTDTFILEYVPKGLAASSDELTIFSEEVKVINKDPLLKLDKQEEIVYYVKGEKDLELGRETKTILLSDNIYSSRNGITGDVTFAGIYEIDLTSPVSLVILIIIISGAYLLYAFDVFGSMFQKSRNKWKENRINKILNLISDATDLVKRGEISRANLLFKELQLVYENSPEEVRTEVYAPAILLLEQIDSAQLDSLIQVVEHAQGTTAEEKEKIMNSRLMLKEAYTLLTDTLKDKYREKLDFVAKDVIQKEIAEH